MENVAVVVIDNKVRSFDIEYSYIIPDTLVDKVKEGVRVYVPFGRGNRKKEALVIKLIDQDGTNLKKILSVIDEKPILDKDMIDIMHIMKKQYICTYYEALSCIIPMFSKKTKSKTVNVAYLDCDRQEVLDKINSNNIRNIWQIKILKYLSEHECAKVPDIIRFIGGGKSSIATLKKNGYIRYEQEQEERNPFSKKVLQRDIAKIPTPSQSLVLEKIIGLFKQQCFSEVLIHGVTGSGKTEVYMQLVQYCINVGKTAIVLVPEIALTPQMMDRFNQRFGDKVAVIHSRLSNGERYDQWNLIKMER